MGTVLVLGGTGRTGGRVVRQLRERGADVRVIVRSAARLPEGVTGDPGLTVVVADVLELSDAELSSQLAGCDAVVCCLGHTVSFGGVFGAPRDLVSRAVSRVCFACRDERPARPVRLVLMSSVSVLRPGREDALRKWSERLLLRVVRAVLPPARDNQRAADLLLHAIGTADPYVQWSAVRPDSLREGDASDYVVHEGLVDGLFRPGHTRMANVADFLCRLATEDDVWEAWRGRLPVVVDSR